MTSGERGRGSGQSPRAKWDVGVCQEESWLGGAVERFSSSHGSGRWSQSCPVSRFGCVGIASVTVMCLYLRGRGVCVLVRGLGVFVYLRGRGVCLCT